MDDPDFFDDVLVPLLWQPQVDILDPYVIAPSDIASQSPASQGLSLSRAGRSLTYGEVLPSSVERDVFRGCMLPTLKAACLEGGMRGQLHTPVRANPCPSPTSPSAAAATTATASFSSEEAMGGSGSGSGSSGGEGAPSSPRAPGLVIYDLGSGTGKIPLQLALLTTLANLPLTACIGVELALDRHKAAMAAHARLSSVTEREVGEQYREAGYGGAAGKTPPATPAALVRLLRSLAPKVQPVYGDLLLHTWPQHAHAVFVNNTVFEPTLSSHLLERLAASSTLDLVVTLRPLCSRHAGVCRSKGAPCCAFDAPFHTTTCNPSWDAATSLFAYKRVRLWNPTPLPTHPTLPPAIGRKVRGSGGKRGRWQGLEGEEELEEELEEEEEEELEGEEEEEEREEQQQLLLEGGEDAMDEREVGEWRAGGGGRKDKTKGSGGGGGSRGLKRVSREGGMEGSSSNHHHHYPRIPSPPRLRASASEAEMSQALNRALFAPSEEEMLRSPAAPTPTGMRSRANTSSGTPSRTSRPQASVLFTPEASTAHRGVGMMSPVEDSPTPLSPTPLKHTLAKSQGRKLGFDATS